MSISSLQLQASRLDEMEHRAPYKKRLFGIQYTVLPKVYGGSTDTELLCDCLDIQRGDDVWEIGTGTGIVALFAEKSGARYVLATDLSPQAVKNAKQNVAAFHSKVHVRGANVYQGIRKKFDVLIFNPPYTNHQAKKLYQICFWDEGNSALRKFFSGARSHLKKGGRAFFCWPSFEEVKLLKQLAIKNGLRLKRVGKRKGKKGFIYYAHRISV